ncbi:MAG: SDR family NAD(P)-dependent oxidoreductase [Proteobacteria bacterium]|nr:SDR family NAD(P)-dependent oxidoreductase [Pseudomonadota bacterium]
MRTVLITGTSSGFGLAAAVSLARRGWKVAATMRDPARSAALVQRLQQEGVASQVLIEPLDVTDGPAIGPRLREVVAKLGGRLDAIVHNAGVAVESAFEDLPDADARRIFETNFFGVLAVTRELLPLLRAQRHGRIIVVSSDSAFGGEPANSVYVASKWAVEGWAESLAFEVEQFGIELALVEPGPYRTEIWSSAARSVPNGSAYTAFMTQLHAGLEKYLSQAARDPGEVGETIAQVAEAKRPRFRNPVGPVARLGHFARGKIPSRVLRSQVARYLGIDKIKA